MHLQQSGGEYSFSAVYQRSWKILSFSLLSMVLIFPLFAFFVNGRVGLYGALIGMCISINFQLLTFLFQSLWIRNMANSISFTLIGFAFKMLLLVGCLTLVYEYFPKGCKMATLVLLISVFINATIQAKILGSSRMVTIEPKST